MVETGEDQQQARIDLLLSLTGIHPRRANHSRQCVSVFQYTIIIIILLY